MAIVAMLPVMIVTGDGLPSRVSSGAGEDSGVIALPLPSASPAPTASPSPSPPPVVYAWGVTEAEYLSALEEVERLSLDEVAGQVIIASIGSPSASSAQRVVRDHHLGGVIVMGNAVESRSQVRSLTGSVEDALDRTWPAWISVDHEGGLVARLSPVLPTMPHFMAAGSTKDKQVVRDTYAAMANDMAGLGFNVNYAPVADVTIGLADPTIRARSAGSDPTNVARTVVAAVQGFSDGGVASTVKHFPGHGSVPVDSHVDLPRYDKSFSRLVSRDLVPFQEAINAGVPIVMMGHIRVDEWGKGPASLEPAAYKYLRDEMGFTGLIVTDALNMGAVTRTHGSGGAAVAALAAGADIVLMPADVGAAHRAIVEAVLLGDLSRTRLNESAARMVALLRHLEGVTHQSVTDSYPTHLIAAGATVVTPICGQPLVGTRVSISGGLPADRSALQRALESHGVTVSSGGTSVLLLGGPTSQGHADVVVALDGPWGFKDSRATSYVGVYGRGSEVMEGLAMVLVGDVTPQAVMPVSVKGLPFGACPSPR